MIPSQLSQTRATERTCVPPPWPTWLAVAQPHLGGIDQLRQRRKLVACQALPHAVRVLLAARARRRKHIRQHGGLTAKRWRQP